MLDKVKLFVAGVGPEVGAHNHTGLTLLLSLLIHKGHATFAPKWWIGQHDIEILTWMTAQTIGYANRRSAIFVAADAMQKEVHDTQSGSVIHNLPAMQGVMFQKAFLVTVKAIVMHNVVVCSKEET